MIMPPRLRQVALLVHVTTSVGSMGAVTAFLSLSLIGLVSEDSGKVQAAYIAMDMITRLVIVPFVFGSLTSGLVQSLGTQWGLFRHYWVLVKLLLTAFVALVLLLQLKPIAYVADFANATTFTRSTLWEARISLAVHASGGLLVLLLTAALSVFKPKGMTSYGLRRQRERRGDGRRRVESL